MTEYHGGPKCLTRVRLKMRPVALTVLVNALILCVLLYRQAFTSSSDIIWWALYVVAALILYQRGRRLKRRVADLVIAAAQHCELMRVFGAASKRAPKG